MTDADPRRDRAGTLHLHGLLAHWNEIANEPWVDTLLGWECEPACNFHPVNRGIGFQD